MARLRPTAAEKALGRMTACSIDSYNFYEGHRLKPQFRKYILAVLVATFCMVIVGLIVGILLALLGVLLFGEDF